MAQLGTQTPVTETVTETSNRADPPYLASAYLLWTKDRKERVACGRSLHQGQTAAKRKEEKKKTITRNLDFSPALHRARASHLTSETQLLTYGTEIKKLTSSGQS